MFNEHQNGLLTLISCDLADSLANDNFQIKLTLVNDGEHKQVDVIVHTSRLVFSFGEF